MKQLGIFAKFWQPGRVKTRLAATLGAEPASQVYRHCLECLLQRLGELSVSRRLCYTPAERSEEFEHLAAGRYTCDPQSAGDLGARMHHYFATALDQGCQRVVLLGSDSPNVPVAWVRQAFDQLRQSEVVLGPSDDGGYWLVGMRQRVADIFSEIPWSTQEVWNATVDRLEQLDVTWSELPRWYDVDDQASLARLIEELDSAQEAPLQRLREQLHSTCG